MMKTRIKTCRDRPASHMSGAQSTTVATTALPATQLWNLVPAVGVPKSLPYVLHGKTMKMHNN